MRKLPQHVHYDKNKDRKVIFSVKLCEFLTNKGHKMLCFEEHKRTNRLIFVFENSNQLHYDIDEYLENRR